MERERIFFSFKTGNVVVIDFPVFAFLSISFFVPKKDSDDKINLTNNCRLSVLCPD